MKTRPRLAVLDYGMGNLRSVCKAWEHVGAEVLFVQAAAAKDLLSARSQPDAMVFPGQGAIMDCMRLLRETGWDRIIRHWIESDRPFFGVCLGLQALFEFSEEGSTPGLGIFPGVVTRFRLPPDYKIPHMGWNTVHWKRQTPVDCGLHEPSRSFYFVHSYFARPAEDSCVWGECEYGQRFVCAVQRGRLYATQFHPEKSQTAGLQIYRNFLLYL